MKVSFNVYGFLMLRVPFMFRVLLIFETLLVFEALLIFRAILMFNSPLMCMTLPRQVLYSSDCTSVRGWHEVISVVPGHKSISGNGRALGWTLPFKRNICISRRTFRRVIYLKVMSRHFAR